VVYFSSEDDEYPASELNAHSPQTRGWQTFRYCEYPQELGFEFDNGVAKISQLQILSHQSKIATKIEIFVGNGTDYHSARFKRLGYLSLDNNERSGYQARELKTVYVEAEARFVKLVVHQCFLNKYNMFNQVGVIAVNFLGTENPSAPKHVSPARGGAVTQKGGSDKGGAGDISLDLNLDPQTAKKLRMLEEAKHAAVEREDYATAKQIKLLEKDIKSLGAELAQLDIAKQQAVKSEDYDRAMMLKKETDGLRAEIEEKVRNIRIPGITDTAPARPSPNTRRINPAEEMRVGGGRGGATVSGAAPLSARGGAHSARDPVHQGDDGYGDEEFEEPPLPIRPARVARADAAIDDGPMRYDDMAPPRSGIASAPETLLPDGDRPIRPKAQPTYMDQDPLAGAAAPVADFGSGNDVETFPPGQHPLQGIANFAELPAPESLQGNLREAADACGLVTLVGEYRVRCLFSRTWALRDAAINKIDMMLKDFVRQPGIDAVVNPLVFVLKTGLDDKIAQVFVSSGAFLDDFLNNLKGFV
jgi:centrosomal protein CEP104